MDALDRRLLREVQQDNAASAAALAERCNTTETTALRRLNRLRRTGVIRSQVAVVDPHKVGRGLMLFVRVRLEREDQQAVAAFVNDIVAQPDVQQFFFVTGTDDYVILLTLRSMEDYDRFVQEHLVSNPLVIMSDTNVVIRALKLSLAVPIDEPESP